MVQLDALVSVPPEQSYPSFSPEQSSRHPTSLPASHISPYMTLPSPHALQTEGSPLHTYLGSIRQSLEQPSRSMVLLSSHSESRRIMLSPHTGLHMSLEVEEPPSQVHVGREPMHVGVQPLVSLVPSSHVSSTSRMPFPQSLQWVAGGAEGFAEQVQSWTEPRHVELQPLESWDPSSHVSVPTMSPSPQISLQI